MWQAFRLGVLLASVTVACLAQAPPVTVYREAKAALRAVPEQARTAQLLAIAEAAQRFHPKIARTDLQQAFADAVALPTGSWQRHVKRYVELSVITDLNAQPDGFGLAHRLALTADIRRAWAYNELISAAATKAWIDTHPHGVPQTNLLSVDSIASPGFIPPDLPPLRTPLPAPGNVVTLAQECVHADGSFPYRGVLAALRFYRLSAPEREALLREGYAAAGRETNAQALPEAVNLLRTGHTLAPALDAELQAAAEPMMPHLQTALRAAATADGDRRARQTGRAAQLHRFTLAGIAHE